MGKYNKPSDVLVLDLINLTNVDPDTGTSISLKTSDVVLGKPAAVAAADGIDWNCAVLCSATRTSPYVGSVTLNYNRLNLTKLFKNIAVNLDVTSAKTTSDLLARLNARYGLAIDKAEVVEATVDALTEAKPTATHTITIADSSLVYFGSLVVTVGPDADVGERLNLVITKNRLDGMHYPVDSTEKGQAYIYSYGVDCNAIRTFLATLATGVDIVDTALAKELNKIVPEVWVANAAATDYNVTGAVVKFAGKTNEAGAELSNTAYNSVVILTLSDSLCSNFTGDLYLHYNA